MEQDLEELRARLEELTRELGDVQRRLAVLEAREGAPGGEPRAGGPEGAATVESREAQPAAPLIPPRTVALVGRTLVVLGGGFLLRAITETAVVPGVGGAIAAFVYAAWWLAQADRTAGAGDRLGAAFHAFGAVLIFYPMIWEVTARFEILGSTAAASALVTFMALGLAVAWRRELEEIAWTIGLFTLATALALAIGTRDFLPYAFTVLLLAGSVEFFAFRDRWLALRWPAAIAIDLAVLMTVSWAVRPDPPPESYSTLTVAGVIALALAVPVLYLGSIGARTVLRAKLVSPFSLVQTAAALLVGVGGAVRVLSFHGASPSPVWVVVLLMGAGYYAAAFASIDRRSGRGRNFYSYTTLAGLLVLVGSRMILDDAVLAGTWSAFAVAAVALGARFDRITLKFHGAIYVVAAAIFGGLLTCAFDGLLADPATEWRPVSLVAGVVAAVAALCYAILVAMPGKKSAAQWPDLLPQAIIGALVVWAVAGLGAPQLAGLLGRVSTAASDPAFLAASRTAVLALLAVALAFAGRNSSVRELMWLVYPLLVLGGAKLVWEDIQHGQPIALFLAFALYGTALILTPTLIRREPGSRGEGSGSP
jgi:hypothetical protein